MGVIGAAILVATLSAGAASNEWKIPVESPEKAVAFYRDVLGFSPIYTSETSAILDGFGSQLKVVKTRKAASGAKAALVFETENLDRQRRELTALGIATPSIQRSTTGLKFSIQDPDGHRIEFHTVFRGEWKRNIEYIRWDKVSLGLDVFVPETPGPHPAVIVVHGGGFTGGDRQSFVQPVLDLLAGTQRYVVFSISYRLAPKHRYPKAVDDVQQALRYVREHASAYKVDPGRIGLLGESAGGYLVSMASTRLRATDQVQAVIAFYGAHDLPARVETQGKIASSIRAFLGVGTPDPTTLNVLARASPVTWVRSDAPPHLLIHGTKDEQVPFSQSTRMCERMTQLKATCEVHVIEGGRHGMRSWDMDVFKTHYKEALLAWLDRHVLAITVPNPTLKFMTEDVEP